MKASGGCLCGQLRYDIDGDPVYQYICHCRDCQRMSGAACLPLIALPNPYVRPHGEVTWYARRADSGRQALEGFCARCGSRVLGAGDSLPGLMLVCAGTLDDPALFMPSADIYTRSAPHWGRMNPALAKWAGDPDA